MKLLITGIMLLSLLGCASLNSSTAEDKSRLDNYKEFMVQIPDHEFDKFEYHRNGWASSANITAMGASKVGGMLVIESVVFTAKYGPESVSVTLEGYGREFAPEGVNKEE